MFKALLTALAIALIGILYADSTPDPAAWYRPLASDYQPPNEWLALMYLEDGRGELHQVEYTMVIDDKTGTVIESNLKESLSDLRLSLNTVVDILSETTIVAVENAWQIQKLNAQFTALGKNLTKVFQVDGMEIKVDDKVYRLKIPEGSLRNSITTGTSIRYDDIDGLFDDPEMDDKSIELKNDYIQIKGWDSEDGSASIFNEDNLGLVARTEGGKLVYRAWLGIDKLSLKSNDSTKKLEISGWSKGESTNNRTLAESLMRKEKDMFDNYKLVVRNASGGVNYIPVGTINTNSTEVVVDEKSITKITETSEDGEESTKLALMGFKDAGGTKDSPAIPYSGDGENLLWQSFLTFFNPNMFESKNGKINLKGLDADEKEVRILTVKAGTDGAAVTSDSMKTFIDQPLEWLNNKITVNGYKEAKEGEYLCRSASGVTWKKVDDSIYADEKSITTNSTPKAFALAGFGDAKENDIPFRDSSKLNWKPLTDFLDTTVDNKSIRLNDKDDLEVAGASNVSSPRKYFGSSTTSSLIGWWDLPNVTTNRVDVDEITLTTDNTADGKVKTIRWKSTPPSTPSLAMMGGNGIEWIPYDGVTNKNAIVGVDDISVATNGNGKLEIKGWSNQEACEADLSKMLTDEGDSDRNNHEILCRVGGQIHYLPLSKGVINVPKIDGDTLVEKGDGTIGLSNSFGVEDGAVPHRVAGGLEWKKVNDIIGDEETIAIDEDSEGTKTIRWMSKPGSSPSLAKMTDNGLEWESIENITNKLAAAMLTDNVTIVTNGEGEVAIKGFADQSNCSAEIAEMLVNPDYSDRNNHSVLCRYGEGESATIHYLPFNDILGNSLADDKTITVKDDGKLVLYGFQNADSGWFPVRSGQELEWKKVPEIVAGKGVTVNPTGNGDYEISLTNVCECVQHDRPQIDDESIVEIDGVWAVNTNYLAGVIADAEGNAIKPDNNTILIDEEAKQFYVNPTIIPTVDADTIIEKGDGTIGLAGSYNAPDESVPTRSGTGLNWVEPTEVTFVVDVIWDESTKTIKKRTATYKIYGTLLTEDEDYE